MAAFGVATPRARVLAALRTCKPSGRRRALVAESTRAAGRGAATDRGLSVQQVSNILASRNIELSVRELGPLFWLTCTDVESRKVLARTNGWIDPLRRVMHCEALQVFTKGVSGAEGRRLRRGPLGLGMPLGVATMAYADSKGCHTAEILAINDYDYQHRRLVRYYSFFGFRKVKEVTGDRLADLPDQLLWGGLGTRMDADVTELHCRWSRALRAPLASESEMRGAKPEGAVEK